MALAAKKVLLAPLDPVHDVGLKLVKRALERAGHTTILLQPDLSVDEIVQRAVEEEVHSVLVGRTLGYNVPEVLARLVDVMEAAGLRGRVQLGVGGMAIRPELAAELGYDRGFGPGTSPEEAVAFVEGRAPVVAEVMSSRDKGDLTSGYSYRVHDPGLAKTLDAIARDTIEWATARTSPAVERGRIRRELINSAIALGYGRMSPEDHATLRQELLDQYLGHCDRQIQGFYRRGERVARTRPLSGVEVAALEQLVARTSGPAQLKPLRHGRTRPLVFVQYGTGCPFMDIAHIHVAESWGADGVVHFDPSWAARREGLMEGYHTHEQDGSLLTYENLSRTSASRQASTLWQVRAHRGLNTPETVVLAAAAGADLTKVNIAYGSLGAGTDPERLAVDGVECMRLSAEAGMAFDVVTNEELCGVPAHKAFAGMLIGAAMAVRLGARPILQPLFCLSPDVMINGQMDDNFVDYNAAKVMALRRIMDAPIWPGAPIGFLTHTEDRVQSATTTALHAALASSLDVDAISIASTDEAYSGGAIAGGSRVDTLRATAEAFRFFGRTTIAPSPRAEEWAAQLVEGVANVLGAVLSRGSFVAALYEGILGSPEDGAYPGRAGRGTVWLR
ncbi:MAG: cobalamin-dependent protein [Bacillota bacterium]